MKMTKARISDIVKNVKRGMNFPKRLNDAFFNDSIARMINHPGFEQEIDDELSQRGLASNQDVIRYMYQAICALRTLNTSAITDFVAEHMKVNDAPQKYGDIYDMIISSFNEYHKKNHNLSDHSIILWSNIDEFVPLIVQVNIDLEKNKNIDDAKNFRNPVSFTSEEQLLTLLESAIRTNQIDRIFSKVNSTLIHFRKEIIDPEHDEDWEIAFQSGVELSNINASYELTGVIR